MIDSTAAGALRRPESVPRMRAGCRTSIHGATRSPAGRSAATTPLWSQRSDGAWRARCPPSTRTASPSCSWIGAAIRWGARRTQGFAWSEGRPAERSVTSWKDAACELAACGLVAHGERRRVHSSVSGVAPIYYVEHAGAVYFASRIDPLVQALPRRYTIDWRAWASIFYLRFPIGERTPFREVKRLRPFSTLEWDADRREAKARQHRWPWAEVEPSLGLDEGAGAIVEAMRAAVAPLARGSVFCTLSGGWDSRLLLCLLAEHGHDGLQAVTVSPDNGHHREEELAAEVATEPRSAAHHPGGRPCGVLGRHARARPAGGLPARGASLGDAAGSRASGTARSGDGRPRPGHPRTGRARTTTPSR